MSKKINTTQRIRKMLDAGYTNKAIIGSLGCKPQAVYQTRYQLNKERGLGSIGTLPKPTSGIGAPQPRKYVRRVKEAGTGIPRPSEPFVITMIEPPTLWERVKRWFRG
jgi:hypothetical protein